MPKILMVVTGHGQIDSEHPTGLWLEEYSIPRKAFRDAGFDVVTASPHGGKSPIDPRSLENADLNDPAIQELEHTETLHVPVREERVVIECAPGTASVHVGNRELHEGERIEVSIMKERVEVRKEPVFAGGIVLRKEVVEGTAVVEGQVRKETLTVEDSGGLVAGADSSARQSLGLP